MPFIYLDLIKKELQCLTTCLALGAECNETSSEECRAVLAQSEASLGGVDSESCERSHVLSTWDLLAVGIPVLAFILVSKIQSGASFLLCNSSNLLKAGLGFGF